MEQKQYKVGVNVLGGAGLSQEQHISLIAAAGWDAFFTGWDPSRIERWANAGVASGLTYSSVHAPFGRVNYMWTEGEEAEHIRAELIECVTACGRYGIPVMVLHPFIGFKQHSPNQIGLDNFARVAEAADRAGVALSFENVEGEEYLAALMVAFADCPQVGFCLDTGHELCYNRGKDMLALYGDRLNYTHFNDNIGVTGDTIDWTDDLHLVMGDGKVNWSDVMRRIRKTGYRGILSCELSLTNKPGKHTQDVYAAMGMERFYRFAYERAVWASGQ